MICPQPDCRGRLDVTSTRHRAGRTYRRRRCRRCGFVEHTIEAPQRIWTNLSTLALTATKTAIGRHLVLKPGEIVRIIAPVR